MYYFMTAVTGDQGEAISRCLMITWLDQPNEAIAEERFTKTFGWRAASSIEFVDDEKMFDFFENHIPRSARNAFEQNTRFTWYSEIRI